MKILNKLKWVSGVALIFLVVLATNLIDKDNFDKLKRTTSTIYNDRIVASDIIFEVSNHIQQLKLAVITNDTSFINAHIAVKRKQIQLLIHQYENTKLTSKELALFQKLKSKLLVFNFAVKEYMDTYSSTDNEIVPLISEIDELLYKLAKVQLNQGKIEMLKSEKTMNSITLFTNLEIIFLILSALLIQFVILYTPKSY